MMIVVHRVAGQMSCIAQRRKAFFFNFVFSLWFVWDYVSGHDVEIIQIFR